MQKYSIFCSKQKMKSKRLLLQSCGVFCDGGEQKKKKMKRKGKIKQFQDRHLAKFLVLSADRNYENKKIHNNLVKSSFKTNIYTITTHYSMKL